MSKVYLISDMHFGHFNIMRYEKLFDINQRRSWFDCESIGEFKLCIEEAISWDKR